MTDKPNNQDDYYRNLIYEILKAAIVDFVLNKMQESGEFNVDEIIGSLESKDILPDIELKAAFWFDATQRSSIKKWLTGKDIIKSTSNENLFSLTEKGKEIKKLNSYSSYEKMQELKNTKLELEVADLKNRIDNFKSANTKATFALIIAAITALLGVIKLMIG